MRPSTAISADGPMNIYNGVVVATLPEARGRGVMVMMNDDLHYASRVTKTNTTHLDTMRSPNGGRAGTCDTGKCTLFGPPEKRHTMDTEFSLPASLTGLPPVAIIYAHANLDDTLIRAAAAAGVKGIVVAGVGDGNMTQTALDALRSSPSRASSWCAPAASAAASSSATSRWTTTVSASWLPWI